MARNKKLRVTMTDRETAWGWIWFLLYLFVLPTALSWLNGLLPVRLSSAWLNFGFFTLNFIALLVIFRDFLMRSLHQLGKRFLPCMKAAILGFVAYWVSNQVLGFLLEWLVPGFSNINDRTIAAMAGSGFIITAIGTVALVPLTEELLYRGLIFQGLYNRGNRAAYIISVVAFAAIHVAGYLGSAQPLTLVLCFLQYLPAGLCLAWAYAEADSIFAPILIHTVINAMGIYAVR